MGPWGPGVNELDDRDKPSMFQTIIIELTNKFHYIVIYLITYMLYMSAFHSLGSLSRTSLFFRFFSLYCLYCDHMHDSLFHCRLQKIINLYLKHLIGFCYLLPFALSLREIALLLPSLLAACSDNR